jgi:predicted GIY-YIG superfamily endonuclease
MPFTCYIIYSEKLDRYYVGHTDSITDRLKEHNSGISKYTAKASDWVIAHTEHYEHSAAARHREFEIKRKKSRKYITWLIAGS